MTRFILAAFFCLFAFGAQAQGMGTITTKPVANCYTAANASTCAAILKWDAGASLFARYAIYRNKTDSCTGALDGADPGTQIACGGVRAGQTTVLLTTSGAGCTAVYHYSLWGTNRSCANADPADATFNNVVAVGGIIVWPAP